MQMSALLIFASNNYDKCPVYQDSIAMAMRINIANGIGSF